MVLNMKATPRFPDPNLRENHDIEVLLDAAEPVEVAAAGERTVDRSVEMSQPAVSAPRDEDIRELRIIHWMLEKFGFSQSCECCARLQRGDPRRSAHTAACRARMYECLSTDDEERPKLEKALDRVADKDARRGNHPKRVSIPGRERT